MSFARKEYAERVRDDIQYIESLGYQIVGTVSDGGKGVVRGIAQALPHKPHQICLAHVHREARKGVGKYPKDPHLLRLKRLIDHVWLLESKEALSWWLCDLQQWIDGNQIFLQEYSHDAIHRKWWFTHSKVRRSVRILVTAAKTSFTFLKGHPLMPRTTNEVEGLNTNITSKWLTHRGLSPTRWQPFLRWFLYFRNQHFLSQLKNSSA